MDPADSAKIPLMDTAIPKKIFAGLKIVGTLMSPKAGDIRVAFDQLTKYISNLNPKHNVGYVHLYYCLERKVDFPILCKDLDVKPEDRALPLQRAQENPMMMRVRTELDHVQRFIGSCNANCRALRLGRVS